MKYCSPDNKGQRSASLPVLGAWIEMYLWQEMTAGNRSLPVRGAWIEMPTVTRQPPHMPVSLPVRGAWIEIGTNPPHTTIWRCRSPCGERGLKLLYARAARHGKAASLPVRGAWIEISSNQTRRRSSSLSLPVRGAWIEMSPAGGVGVLCSCRSPCGERGLKYRGGRTRSCPRRSLPVRGAWIEILFASIPGAKPLSLPVRGAWIEMPVRPAMRDRVAVAPRAGSVD